jgi:dihydrofolate reductase
MLILIAAVAENLVIGKGLELPWHLPLDLKRFKALTVKKPLVMGRRTFESLIHQFGKPLPNRRNIVLSRTPLDFEHKNVEWYPNAQAALDALKDEPEVYIGGGAKIYADFLEKCDRWEITVVHQQAEGDVFFPEYRHLINVTHRLVAQEQHDGFSFLTYEKIP